jgi:NAD(P)-dependent dehydrogenase (short-subunit alcohol dehydrogenase family)
MRMKNKFVVVTGGASGIGAACCRLFAREGARVAVLDRDEQGARLLRDEIGGSAAAFRIDVAVEDDVREGMSAIAAEFGRIDVLVNNAGIAVRCPAGELSDADWQRVMDVNLRGAFLCSKHALPHLHPGGSIIHMSSVVGITGTRNRAVYSASKGGLVALTRNMAMDYAGKGIRVNCICPGFVRTPFTAKLFSDEDRRNKLQALHPLGRLGEPDDVANAVLFLASDEASWITGIALPVDGGFSAGHGVDV